MKILNTKKVEALEDDFPFETGDFQMNHVSFPGYMHCSFFMSMDA